MVEQMTLLLVVAVVVVGLVAGFARKWGVAAPLALVLAGAGISALPWTPHVELEPSVVLGVLLPPLLYTAALAVPFVDFRRNIKVIASLSVVLVVLSAVGAAAVVHLAVPGVGIALALALGAVVSAPDAVAAISLGKRLGLPPRVVTIMEGEGLVNDATALVLLSTALAVATSGGTGMTPWGVLGSFVWAVVGAVLIGLLVGNLSVWWRSHMTEEVTDIAASLVIPFVAFLLAEAAHASGVVAVVVAGITVGNEGPGRIPASRRRQEGATWEAFTALVENGVFLLMGYLLPPLAAAAYRDGQLWTAVCVGLLVTVVLVAVRFAYLPFVVTSMRRSAQRKATRHEAMVRRFDEFEAAQEENLSKRFRRRLENGRRRLEQDFYDITAENDQRLGWRDSVVLGMAGMRGVVTIAASQTLPSDHPQYRLLVLVAFVVALATLLPQGFLLPTVVRALHLSADSSDRERKEVGQLMQRLGQASVRGIKEEVAREPVDPAIAEGFKLRITDRARRAEGMQQPDDALMGQFRRVRAAALAAERSQLQEEKWRGEFSSQAIVVAERMLDDHEIQLERMDPAAGW